MANRFKLFYISLFTLIICGAFSLTIYIIYITNDKLTLILCAFLILLIDAIFGLYIINSRRNINTKACWILALLYLPLVGCILFLIFGTKTYSDKSLKKINEENIFFNKYENYSFTKKILDGEKTSIFYQGYNADLKPVYEKNKIELIKNNQIFYEKIIENIRLAKKFIHIQTYIIRDGFFCRALFSELIAQAKKGIKVKLLYDWYGCWKKIKKKAIKQLKINGVEVGVFNPAGINMFKGLTNFRSHRKAIIIDNKVAITGGSNIADEYLNMRKKCFFWKDLNFILTGEIVNSLNISFCKDWLSYTDYSVKNRKKNEFKKDLPSILKKHKCDEGNTKIQLNISSPFERERNIGDILNKAIFSAKHSIKIVTPYFIPPSNLIENILCMAKNGIKIELMLPGKADVEVLDLIANRNSYKILLENKVKIYEYNGFIHSKFVLIDNKYIITGSNNLDFRSLFINFENALLIEDNTIAKEFNDVFEYDKNNCREINLQEVLKMKKSIIYRMKIFFLNCYKPIL